MTTYAFLLVEVLAFMKKLSEEGYTMIVVTHEMDFARAVSNQVVFLDKGILIEQSSPEELFNNPKSDRVKRFLSTENR
jgi:polar amino acid transport system ATP-binding protein